MNDHKNRLGNLLQLCQFSDSALPIGSFAFSNGLESAIQMKFVTDDKTLKDYILISLKQSAQLDGIYINHAYDSAANRDVKELVKLDLSYYAKRVGKEQQLMSTRIGNKLATLFLKIKKSELLVEYLAEAKKQNGQISHSIVHGIISSELSLSRSDAFGIYQYGIASMILSAAVRLMRIDHYQTQRILFEVNETVDDDYNQIENLSINDSNSFAPIFDCLITQHVNAHVRMFMN